MDINEFYKQSKKIGIPSEIIAGDIITFIRDSRKGEALSLQEVFGIKKDIYPNGYKETNSHVLKELHDGFSDEEIKEQILRFRENADLWGFPTSLIDDIVTDFLTTAKALDASSLDDIFQYNTLGVE